MGPSIYDVIVAGGGPGGSTIAARLSLGGLRVLVLEKEAFPRFHLGESLLPMSLEVFDAIGVTAKLDAALLRKYGAWFIDGLTGEEVEFQFESALRPGYPHAFHGPRDEIDAILLSHAASIGADVRHGWEVLDILWRGERAVGVVARGPEGATLQLNAGFVVDATGRRALLNRRSGKRRTPKLERTLAVFAHFDGCRRLPGRHEGDIRIVLVPQGWLWVIPFRGNRASVGIVLTPNRAVSMPSSLDQLLHQIFQASPVMKAIMSGASQVFPARAAADFSYRVAKSTGDGWIAIGDAAGFIDPLFSTGFHLAVKNADVAAPLVRAALAIGDVSRPNFADYEQVANRARETYTGVVQAFYDGRLLPLLFETRKRDMMRRMITSLLAGDVFHDDPPRWLRELVRRFPYAGCSADALDEVDDATTLA